MSKPITITTASLVAIIEEINEEITAVTISTIDHVITIVQDSIHEDCTWYGNPVTVADIEIAIIDWIQENVEEEADYPALTAIRDAVIANRNAYRY